MGMIRKAFGFEGVSMRLGLDLLLQRHQVG